jgi:predicted nuclease of predicted toxin-antitoxin system
VKIKLDENMPRRIETLLRSHGHEVDIVHDESLVGHPDPEVALAVRDSSRMLMTLDRGFPAAAVLPVSHPGIVVIKLRDQSVLEVERAVAHLLSRGDLEELSGCIVIVTADRIRVRRPNA